MYQYQTVHLCARQQEYYSNKENAEKTKKQTARKSANNSNIINTNKCNSKKRGIFWFCFDLL
ncbi:unnamed protein product, partial [Gulo gulo]